MADTTPGKAYVAGRFLRRARQRIHITRIFHEFKLRQIRGAQDKAVLQYRESFATKQMT
jgi:hypothetical protein